MDFAEKLFHSTVEMDSWLLRNRKKADVLIAKLNPRTRFNLWRDSGDGQQWREQQYQHQSEKCAICKEKMERDHIHIDHIEPIAKRPDLVLELNNLQLTHPECNAKKSTQ